MTKIEKFKGLAIKALSLIVTCYILYTAVFGKFTAIIQRGVFITLIMMLGFLMTKHKKETPVFVHVLDVLLSLLSLACGYYLVSQYNYFATHVGIINPRDTIMGGIFILLLMECCRRIIPSSSCC